MGYYLGFLATLLILAFVLIYKSTKKEFILPTINGIKKQGLAHAKDPSIIGYENGQINIYDTSSGQRVANCQSIIFSELY